MVTQPGESWYILHHLDTDSIIAEIAAGEHCMQCTHKMSGKSMFCVLTRIHLMLAPCHAVRRGENWFISRNIWLSPGSNIPQMSNSFCCERAKFQQNISPYLIILDRAREKYSLQSVWLIARIIYTLNPDRPKGPWTGGFPFWHISKNQDEYLPSRHKPTLTGWLVGAE